ncbi:DNA-processing protein DprA [Cytobacillus oceanisediminis]|uniref:DNA-processing protein DprA n=1 Tax=Cytobacillus oceanisediminis TaxID=665099 RepID=UPI001C242E7C|nr:DNA-processing protein DprA [Cytobacillus oceanisediminis]MBU8768768.1 DNA-processing protein DprA [Cytobacillus oceanisediminis]
MLKDLLKLKYLRLDGGLINFIVNNFNSKDRASLFNGEAFELQFKYNAFKEEELAVFYNEEKLKKADEYADNLIEKSNEQNVSIVSYYDEAYPINLKAIKQCPLFIFVKGNLDLLNSTKSVACVGTRKASEKTLKLVGDIVKDLVEEEIVIISGLAKGIDAQSHKECLAHNGKTIAVMAHGLDTIYPKENTSLAESILENGGTLVSEYPIGIKGHKSHFVARNRIISGLSEGVIVFEADEKSGTMHTARFAYSQGKKIFCPNLTAYGEKLSSGVEKLLKTESAFPITNGKELINKLFLNKEDFLNIKIKPSTIKALESISKSKEISIEELIDSLILKYIEGERGYE